MGIARDKSMKMKKTAKWIGNGKKEKEKRKKYKGKNEEKIN